MQEVYKDGSMGKVKDLDLEMLQESLAKLEVDHVRIFNKETGGQLQIEVHDLKAMIAEAVESALKKHDIMQQYIALNTKPI